MSTTALSVRSGSRRLRFRDVLERVLHVLPTVVWVLLIFAAVVWLPSTLRSIPPSERVERVAAWAPSLLGAAAAVALMAMALIEAVKRLLRSRFHARELRDWLDGTASRSRNAPAPSPSAAAAPAADAASTIQPRPVAPSEQLLQLMAPQYRDDVLGLPSELLCAQIGGTVEIVLAHPRRYLDLLCALAGERGRRDVMRYLKRLRDFKATRSKPFPRPPQEAERDETALIDARNAVGHRVQRHLDAFQIHISAAWGTLLRVLAIAVSTVIAAAGATVFGTWWRDPVGTAFVVVFVGLIGGVLSSAARDVFAMVERVRR